MSREAGRPSQAPPDQHVRDRIRTDLVTNLLVEAGAGSGKTTSLVRRMVALVRSGESVERIAAVTFTRKAAAELKERFRDALEEALRDDADDPETRERLLEAVSAADRGFVGTIHAFCARLLRERPIEAGVDPSFTELMEAEHEVALLDFWRVHLDRLAAAEDPLLIAVLDVDLRPADLLPLFRELVENPDVTFPADRTPAPDPEELGPAREAIEAWLDRALDLLPGEKPGRGWGRLQKKVLALRYSRSTRDWDSAEGLLDAITLAVRGSSTPTQYLWGDTAALKGKAKALGADLERLVADLGLDVVHDRWMGHRYQPALAFAGAAAVAFAEERRRRGLVSFQDLLSLTAELLRRNPQVRKDLGGRFRRLLVDEFQDTDPVQAEIAFLLASDPTEAELEGSVAEADWWSARPRPGSLFVVGDPKQSIYRFRRADIVLYDAVRRRFETEGAVLTLRSNFRSVSEIAGLVNDVFGSVFPAEGDRYSPRNATMLPQRDPQEAPARGVFRYTLPKGDVWQWSEENAQDEARRIASWIRRRIDAGERGPGDFLVLTWKKARLHVYARALDDAGVPAEVSGARVEVERGLEELLAVLKALADPGDPVRTAAVLTGLFFGLDLDQLVDHRLAGGHFDCRWLRDPEDEAGPVDAALARLRGWWERSTRSPCDVFLGWLVDEVGLLIDAAAGDLASVRTGVLLYALDAVRRSALAGDSTLVGAISALETAIEWSDAETPLHPTQADTVRVMNVHKAKGLESPVVILAEPGGYWAVPPDIHVDRMATGAAVGYLEVAKANGRWRRVLAYPTDWAGHAEEETRFLEAERDRIRYVAATRAGEELVVATRRERSGSPWKIFEPWLSDHAQDLGDLEPEPTTAAPALATSAAEILAHGQEATARRLALAEPTYRFRSVTEVAKGSAEASAKALPEPTAMEIDLPVEPAARGLEWGTVVHATLAGAGELDGDDLARLCRALLIQQNRPLDEHAEPVELPTLLEMVARVRASDLWRRASASPTSAVEVPFQVEVEREPVPSFIEGVIDLAFEEDDGWVIVDYKTDVGDDPDFAERAVRYRAQVDLYADALTRLTGRPVKERVLFYTARSRVESW